MKSVIERAVLLCDDAVVRPNLLQLDGWVGTTREMDAVHPESQVGSSNRFVTSTRTTAPPSDQIPQSERSSAQLKAAPINRVEQLRAEIERDERDRIVKALRQGVTQAGAAEILGMSRRALIYKLDAYGIPRPRKGRSK